MKKILAIVLTLVMLLSCAAFAEEVKPVILVVSFGTSYNDNRDLSIGAVRKPFSRLSRLGSPPRIYCSDRHRHSR